MKSKDLRTESIFMNFDFKLELMRPTMSRHIKPWRNMKVNSSSLDEQVESLIHWSFFNGTNIGISSIKAERRRHSLFLFNLLCHSPPTLFGEFQKYDSLHRNCFHFQFESIYFNHDNFNKLLVFVCVFISSSGTNSRTLTTLKLCTDISHSNVRSLFMRLFVISVCFHLI